MMPIDLEMSKRIRSYLPPQQAPMRRHRFRRYSALKLHKPRHWPALYLLHLLYHMPCIQLCCRLAEYRSERSR